MHKFCSWNGNTKLFIKTKLTCAQSFSTWGLPPAFQTMAAHNQWDRERLPLAFSGYSLLFRQWDQYSRQLYKLQLCKRRDTICICLQMHKQICMDKHANGACNRCYHLCETHLKTLVWMWKSAIKNWSSLKMFPSTFKSQKRTSHWLSQCWGIFFFKERHWGGNFISVYTYKYAYNLHCTGFTRFLNQTYMSTYTLTTTPGKLCTYLHAL